MNQPSSVPFANRTHTKLPVALILTFALLPALAALPAQPLTLHTVGSWLGWVGSGLLAASLLLIVRVPRLALWCGGLERMYRWHHVLGTLGYTVLLIHPLVLAGQSFPGDPIAAWHVVSPFHQSWAGLLGWIALVLLMVGLGSTFAVRLSYSRWRFLHALLSIGILVGIAHLVAFGGFTASSWLVIAPAALVLGWRLLYLDRGGNARPYEVNRVSHLTERLTEATLRPLTKPLAVAPGQFVMAAFFEGPHFRGCGEYHPYSVSGVQAGGAFTLGIKALGDCTRHIQFLEPGVAARVQGPFGTFLADRTAAPELWIAGGIGITPFLAVLREAPVTRSTELFYLFRPARTAPYCDELADYAASQTQLRFHPLATQEEITPLLTKLALVSNLSRREVYLCGPSPLIDAVTAWLRQQNVPGKQIHFERFDFR